MSPGFLFWKGHSSINSFKMAELVIYILLWLENNRGSLLCFLATPCKYKLTQKSYLAKYNQDAKGQLRPGSNQNILKLMRISMFITHVLLHLQLSDNYIFFKILDVIQVIES